MRQIERAAPPAPLKAQFGGSLADIRERDLHILIVEDDPELRDCLVDHASDRFGRVTGCRTAGQARYELTACRRDIILLDLNLPDGGGLTFLSELLSLAECALVVITGESDDRIRAEAINLGACDLLVKPFGMRELEARLRAALRRRQIANGPEQTHWIALGPWRIDPDTRAAQHKDGELVGLTRMEFRILSALAERRGRILSRENLIRQTQAESADVFDRSIDSLISRLRKKLEVDPARPEHILTVWGEGYRLVRSATNR